MKNRRKKRQAKSFNAERGCAHGKWRGNEAIGFLAGGGIGADFGWRKGSYDFMSSGQSSATALDVVALSPLECFERLAFAVAGIASMG